MKHPNLKDLPPGVAGLVQHFLTCGLCREKMLREARPLRAKEQLRRDLQPADYRALGLGELEVTSAPGWEPKGAPHLLVELLALPPEERTDKVRQDPRFHSYRLAESLLGHNFEPPSGESGAVFARLVLEVLSEVGGAPGSTLQRELEVLARTALGEALRREGEEEQAEEELTCAAEKLSGAIGIEPETRALFCQSLGSLRRDQGRFDESLALFSYAAELWRDAGAWNQEAEMWLEVGDIALVEALDPERALAAFDSAAALAGISCRSAFHALSGTVRTLLVLEQPGEARELLEQGRRRLGLRRRSREGLELLALEGRVEAECGRLGLARERLAEAFRGLVRRGSVFAALQTGIELARLLARDSQGRESLSKLLFELEDLAGRRDLPRPIGAAVKSCLSSAPSSGSLVALSDYLERAGLRPHLKFSLEEPDCVFRSKATTHSAAKATSDSV